MKILITGANGMLATHIINQLIRKGYEVRAMLREPKKYQLDPDPHVEICTGDILNREAVDQAVRGSNALVHAAAITDPGLPSYSNYRRVNVLGAENVLHSAIIHHLKRVVYVSSANAIGHGTKENPGQETHMVRPPFTKSLYARSKLEAQNLVLSFSGKTEVVVVNPSFMIGAFDAKEGSGRIVKMGYNKKFLFYPPGGKNFVNAKDVAKGVVAAVEKGQNGRIYLLTGHNLSYREFFQKLAFLNNQKTSLIRIPRAVLRTAGYLSVVPKMFNLRTEISPVNMETLAVNNYYNNSRAKKELGLTFDPIEQGIGEAISWFKDQKML